MKLTDKQLKDLKTIMYFIPQSHNNIKITDNDINNFFLYSDKGENKNLVDKQRQKRDGFNALCEGKTWRGIFVGMYEEGILDGSMPYAIILEGMPIEVKDFMKKELFKGTQAEKIDEIWESINNKTILQRVQNIIISIKVRIKYMYLKYKRKFLKY